jgi:hypothetical protein
MTLLIYYIALTLLGTGVAVMIGLWTEKLWPAASLPVFLTLYFGMLWAAWILAVHVTKPKDAPAAPGDPRNQPAE